MSLSVAPTGSPWIDTVRPLPPHLLRLQATAGLGEACWAIRQAPRRLLCRSPSTRATNEPNLPPRRPCTTRVSRLPCPPCPVGSPLDVGPVGEDGIEVQPPTSCQRSRHHRSPPRGDRTPTLTLRWGHGPARLFQPLGQAGAVRPWAKLGPTLFTN
jgi:hypothetical protein